VNGRIHIKRKALFAEVTLIFKDADGIPRTATTTMDRDVKSTDARVVEFKRRMLQKAKKQ